MGHKGVSKRKPVQTKSRPLSGGAVIGKDASVAKAFEREPVKAHDNSMVVPAAKNGGKTGSNGTRNIRKG